MPFILEHKCVALMLKFTTEVQLTVVNNPYDVYFPGDILSVFYPMNYCILMQISM